MITTLPRVPAASELPRVDEHSVDVCAPPSVLWRSVAEIAEGTLCSGWATTASRLLGCRETAATGPRPLATGSTLPGFSVEADEPDELVMLGRHRFSDYALIFRIDDLGDGNVRLRAESRAEFPGVSGSLYRAVVIGTCGHALLVNRLLHVVKSHAERS